MSRAERESIDVEWYCLSCDKLVSCKATKAPSCGCSAPIYAPKEGSYVPQEHFQVDCLGDGESRVFYLLANYNGNASVMAFPDKVYVPAKLRGRPGLITWSPSALTLTPDWHSPPGDTISDLLEERSMGLDAFASAMAMTQFEAERLLSGGTEITEAIASKLVGIFGSTVEFWLERDRQYRQEKP